MHSGAREVVFEKLGQPIAYRERYGCPPPLSARGISLGLESFINSA